MAVVRNLMIRIGADYSGAKREMQGASSQLNRFKRDTTSATSTITGRRGFGGVASEFSHMASTVSGSLQRMRGAQGIGGVIGELKTLTPALRGGTSAMGSFGASAASTGSKLGAVGLAATIATFALVGYYKGLYKASQPAVKFEADLGRLNISLHEGAGAYMDWAEAQGLARTTSAQLGATYGNLLGSFIKDTKELQQSTQDLVQATRVVASYTGRQLDDVFNRIRSGMLGSTEAIEDLGIYVNISMIESTKAFRKFAGDKSWAQLDFQTQQQIRLMAILEQAQARYGNTLQNNTMTKQEQLMEQLKEIKLTWSEAWQPVWDEVIPGLIKLAKGVNWVIEKFAELQAWLHNWDPPEAQRNADKMTESVDNQADAFEGLADSAKSAKKELAGFDKLNLLGSPSVGSASGLGLDNSAAERLWRATQGKGIGGEGEQRRTLPGIIFGPPEPPDMGLGAVATNVTASMDALRARVAEITNQTWDGVEGRTSSGAMDTIKEWGWLNSGTAQLAMTMAGAVTSDWQTMWNIMRVTQQQIQPQIISDWEKMKVSIESLKVPLGVVKKEWKGTLSDMQQQLNAYRPYLEWGWKLIAIGVRNLQPALSDIKADWKTTLEDMYQTALVKFGGILGKIAETTQAWNHMLDTLNKQPNADPASNQATNPASNPMPTPVIPEIPTITVAQKSSNERAADAMKKVPVVGDIMRGLDWLRDKTSALEALAPYAVPGVGPVSGIGSIGGLGKLGKLGSGASTSAGGAVIKGLQTKAVGAVDDAIAAFSRWMKEFGTAIPGFASGAEVRSPTLAMIGEYAGARSNPEIVAPQSIMRETVSEAVDSDAIVEALERVERAVRNLRNIQAVISRDAVGRASTDYIRDEQRRGRNPLPSL